MGLIGSILLAVFGVITAILVAILSRVLADDFKAWTPRLVDWLIRRAVAGLPDDQQERFDEEWRSAVSDMPGELSKFIWAADLVRAAYSIVWSRKILAYRNTWRVRTRIMAAIEQLKIGTPVRYRDTRGILTDGKIVGRRVNGHVEGDVDPDRYPYTSGNEPDRVKVALVRIGMSPETISVSCSPDVVECID